MAAALQGACVTYPSRALTQWEKESNPDIKMTLHDVSWFGKYTYGITILVVVVIGVIVVAIVFVPVIVVVVSVFFLFFLLFLLWVSKHCLQIRFLRLGKKLIFVVVIFQIICSNLSLFLLFHYAVINVASAVTVTVVVVVVVVVYEIS
jgi:hypothetical protein